MLSPVNSSLIYCTEQTTNRVPIRDLGAWNRDQIRTLDIQYRDPILVPIMEIYEIERISRGKNLGMWLSWSFSIFPLLDILCIMLTSHQELVDEACGWADPLYFFKIFFLFWYPVNHVDFLYHVNLSSGACGRGMWLRDIDLTDWGRTVSWERKMVIFVLKIIIMYWSDDHKLDQCL